MTELVTPEQVVAQGRTWLGTPYIHQHRSKGFGVDCVGLPIGFCRELRLVAPDFDVTGYGRTPDGKTMLATCDKFMTRVPMRELAIGHMMVFAFESLPQHMGLIGNYKHGGFSVIQALGTCDGGGRVIEWQLTRGRKGWKLVQAYRLPGVA